MLLIANAGSGLPVQGDIATLKRLHDELDEAVAKAYGWPANLSNEEILAKLLELNKRRTAEEAAGKIRWLRPVFQSNRG